MEMPAMTSMTSQAVADEIRREYQSRYGEPRHEVVELGRVRDYLLSMDEPAELGADGLVPALFVLTLGRTRRPQPPKGSAVNVGDDYEFFAPLHVGDRITISRSVLSVDEKEGKQGRMFLLRAEVSYNNQHGAKVAQARLNMLRWGW
jgi:N-terminal half of MaoC dehydratase